MTDYILNKIKFVDYEIKDNKTIPSSSLTHEELKEIQKLLGKEKGLVVIPLEIFSTPRGWLKIRLALAKPRKKTDKREYIKKRDDKREIREFNS